MIYEEAVIAAVSTYLTANGYLLQGRPRSVRERGIDLVARKQGEEGWLLHVEAKGEGSSKEHTARYGNPFDAGQVTSCVSKACFAALQVVSAQQARAGVAFPKTPAFEKKVEGVRTALERLGVAVFWVDADGHVGVESTWSV